MTIIEKVDVLKNAGLVGTEHICAGIRCDECLYKDYDDCQLVIAVENIERMGYNIVIK